MNFLKKDKTKISSLTILLVIILGCIPIQLIMTLSQDEALQDAQAGVDTLRGAKFKVTKLMKKKPSKISSLDYDSPSKTTNNSHTIPNFTIGQQTGTGEGTYNIYDSFNWTGQEVMNTSNEYVSNKPTSNADSLSITNSTGFNRQYGVFNITNVIAEYNKSSIEDDTTSTYWTSDTNFYYEIAMSFDIDIDYAYLKKVRTYTAASTGANGTIYVTDDDAGGKPDETSIKSSKEILNKAGIGWHEYSFDSEILLERGQTYFVVMNESTLGGEYWWWYYTLDSVVGDGDNEGTVYYRQGEHWGGTWWLSGSDLPLQIEILPVEWNGTHYNPTTYTNPSELDFTYESSEGSSKLSTFKQFQWNDSTWHKFSTNTSVSFDLSFVANYTYASTPISATSSYLVSNNSIVNWNLTFSTAALNTTYDVRNHAIRIIGIEQDWNGTKIYWNDSSIPEYTSLTNNVNITWDGDPAHKYTYGNTTMVVNTSTLADNVTWYVWFNATNYLLDFNLSRGGQYLSFPYEANVTDTLGINIRIPTSGGNASYWIEYFDGQRIHNRTDFSAADFTDQWIINDNVSQTTNVNGTYYLQAFWVNSGATKVGTMTRSVDVLINTSLSVLADIKVVIGQLFNITANYKSIHNNTDVKAATIWCNSSWTANVTMNQVADDSYNASLITTGQGVGTTGLVTITTQMGWFVNWTKIITVKFIGDSSLTVNETNVILEWRENTTLRIDYNDTLGDPIESGMVTVDGNNAFNINDVYYYRLNTTDYAGEGDYPDLVINATHPDYVSREIVFNLTITPGETNISGRG
ncbi:MAG: hypothetical protein ACFE95_14030, partial [Candidatus Hodarchaeota archaeon]